MFTQSGNHEIYIMEFDLVAYAKTWFIPNAKHVKGNSPMTLPTMFPTGYSVLCRKKNNNITPLKNKIK